ncbi:MAG: response regulator [candidate division Zixibacteria bacterium]|nr:response regulator [candidate division Zixibacteria bacterium]
MGFEVLEGVKALVVDDEETVREVLSRSLSAAGCQVTVKTNGKEALEFLKQNQVSILITDIVMPEMDGVQLLKEAKELYPYLPVYLITGHSNKITPKGALELGAEHLLTKPFKNVEIIQRIRASMERSKHIAEKIEQERSRTETNNHGDELFEGK